VEITVAPAAADVARPPSEARTPVEPAMVRPFAEAEAFAWIEIAVLPVPPAEAVTPVRAPRAVLRPARSWIWPEPVPKVIVWAVPEPTVTDSVAEPAVPPFATMVSRRLVELTERLVEASV